MNKVFYKNIDITQIEKLKLKELVKIMEGLSLCFKGIGNGKVKLINTENHN